MQIAAIVDSKGRHFETVSETTSLVEAISTMHRLSIGSIGVVGGRPGEVLGIVSQKELMAAIADCGSHGLSLPVLTYMRKPIPCCNCEDAAAQVMRMMTRERSRHALVRNRAGSVVGIVSMGDLVAALLADAQLEAGVLRDMARSHLLALPA